MIYNRMVRGLAFLAAFALAMPASCQALPQQGAPGSPNRGRTNTSRRQSANPKENDSLLPLATFRGTVKGVDSKTLTILPADSENMLEFYCTKKTKYFDRKQKKIKNKDIRMGDTVSIDSRMAPFGTPDAVNVHVEPAKSPASSDSHSQ